MWPRKRQLISTAHCCGALSDLIGEGTPTQTMNKLSKAGFTLIELMIVVAIIAIIASIAIPKLMSARLSANEAAAVATLRSLSSAQAQIQSSSAIDTDADGGGEYGYFAELAGQAPLRVSTSGSPTAGAVGTDELSPSVLSSAFGSVDANGVVVRSGFCFQVFLPGSGSAPTGVSEDSGGGKTSAPFPDSNNCEIMWCAYAWPLDSGNTGNRCFFINQEGDLMQTSNRGASAYTGADSGPGFDAAYTTASDMASPVAVGVAGNDGGTWVAVQ